MCNCLFWCIAMKLRWGGKINWKKSRTWIGFHTTWTNPMGREWEYTLERVKIHPWWYIPMCYRGVIKRVI